MADISKTDFVTNFLDAHKGILKQRGGTLHFKATTIFSGRNADLSSDQVA
jgi:hypothetical protein